MPGSPYSLGISFNLTSAPVMFHLEHDSSLFEEIDKGIESVKNIDYAKVRLKFIILTIMFLLHFLLQHQLKASPRKKNFAFR